MIFTRRPVEIQPEKCPHSIHSSQSEEMCKAPNDYWLIIWAIKNTPIPSHYTSWLIGFPILWSIIIPSKPGRIKSPFSQSINQGVLFMAHLLAVSSNPDLWSLWTWSSPYWVVDIQRAQRAQCHTNLCHHFSQHSAVTSKKIEKGSNYK